MWGVCQRSFNMLGEIIYNSFLSEKGRTDYFRLGKARKSFLSNVKLWNIIAPCLIHQDNAQTACSLSLLSDYEGRTIDVAELKCFSDNPTASEILYFLINQINIELCGGRNNQRLNILIRACHNLPRCMINGNMYCSEELCIQYSLANMDDDIRNSITKLITK